MASLVADYGDSSGESDSEDKPLESGLSISKSEKQGINFFGEAGDDGSSEESDKDVDTDEKSNSRKIALQVSQVPKLPTPVFHEGVSHSKLAAPHLIPGESKVSLPSSFLPGGTSSVFVNPFEQAEQAKLGILERHVRLTEAAPTKPASKPMCFKFKKGKCHLGDKCRFFHDRSNIALGSLAASSGLNSETEQDSEQGFGFGHGDKNFQFPGHGESNGTRVVGQLYHPAACFSAGQPADPNICDDDNYMKAMKGKKRFGVTDNLQPPKKALVELDSHRTRERPWTVMKKNLHCL